MLSAIASTPPANWRKRNLAPPAAPRPSRAPQFVKRKNRRRRPPAAAPPSRIERVGLARAYEQRVRLTRGISADRSVPPSPRPIRGVTETTSSQWPPSWNDTDVAGWRRVSCWSDPAAPWPVVASVHRRRHTAPIRSAARSSDRHQHHRRRRRPTTAPYRRLAQVAHPQVELAGHLAMARAPLSERCHQPCQRSCRTGCC